MVFFYDDAIALVFGVLLVLPIGGADMPVVISLLNAFTGLAAASAGFVLENNALIIAGTLVGASGTLLTVLMGRAMNRSIANVLFGAFGGGAGRRRRAAAARRTASPYREATADDAAVHARLRAARRRRARLRARGRAGPARRARARRPPRERGVDVKYAIHPVAGRMPGHMNVLLAEAHVPYPQLYDMDDINPEFPRTDVALVIGANDVTNPAARDDPASPLYGMPILNVDQAANVVVLKRSMSPGFAGIDNDLFYERELGDALRRREVVRREARRRRQSGVSSSIRRPGRPGRSSGPWPASRACPRARPGGPGGSPPSARRGRTPSRPRTPHRRSGGAGRSASS